MLEQHLCSEVNTSVWLRVYHHIATIFLQKVAAINTLRLRFSNILSVCTVNHTSTLHEVEPILPTIYRRTYKTLTPTREECVAEAVIGDGGITMAQKWNAVLYLRSIPINWHYTIT